MLRVNRPLFNIKESYEESMKKARKNFEGRTAVDTINI